MAVRGEPGEHLAAAQELLAGLESITSSRSGDAQVRATAAVAHATLALAEQIGIARHQFGGAD